MPSNPAPRAALSAEGGVARPVLHRRRGPAPPPAPPAVAAEPAHPAAPAKGAGPKAKGKKRRKDTRPERSGPQVETVDIVVPLTKPVRRALKSAAAQRETTPEELAALVLSAWLDR
jgi:hypothetical protein